MLGSKYSHTFIENPKSGKSVEYLEIKADVEFGRAIFDKRFPTLASSAGNSVWRREFAQCSDILLSKDSLERVTIASLVMFFQE